MVFESKVPRIHNKMKLLTGLTQLIRGG